MSSTDPDPIPLVAGASLLVRPPEGAAREADDALPVIDVSNLPGAWIAARRGYRSEVATLRVCCAAAPASGWATGVEEIVLARATQLARGTLGGEITRFTVGESAVVGPRFEQGFEGAVRHGDEVLAVRGRHWLGFAGEDPRDAIVCTLACTESEAATPGICAGLLAAATPVGAWVEAPPPSVVARALLLGAERPREAAGLLFVASLAAAALVIARRPRPRA
jgi:hypothetical protein